MADWTVIPDASLDPDAPLTSDLAYAWRDNAIAIAEGAANAPRVTLSAIERLEPGSQIRSRIDAEEYIVSGSATGHGFSFMQEGTIRYTFQHYALSTSGSPTCDVLRTRNGVSSVIYTFSQSTSYVSRSVDVDVRPGDRVYAISSPGATGGAGIRNCRFQTNGQNLWPGTQTRLEGNVFL